MRNGLRTLISTSSLSFLTALFHHHHSHRHSHSNFEPSKSPAVWPVLQNEVFRQQIRLQICWQLRRTDWVTSFPPSLFCYASAMAFLSRSLSIVLRGQDHGGILEQIDNKSQYSMVLVALCHQRSVPANLLCMHVALLDSLDSHLCTWS